MSISQHPIGVEYQSISGNATADTVQIRTVMGEYVVGGWKVVENPNLAPKSTLTITLQAVWNSEANIQFLRWQENDKLYEIIFSRNDKGSHSYQQKKEFDHNR